MKNNYHHGNLREALIDEGIKIINEYGEAALSLRKVAAACGVSHAAPYAHFSDKDSLIEAIKENVTKKFSDELEKAVSQCDNMESAIIAMGKQYVLFFRDNPDYFYFLFHKQQITVHTSMDMENANDYKPYLMLRNMFKKYLIENNIEMDEKQQELEIIKTWSVVQGLSSIVTMKNVVTSFEWKKIVDDILK